MEQPRLSTFSIVAQDRDSGDLGVATHSKFIAVGTIVPWAKATVGAVATQATTNVSYGPRGLRLLEAGHAPEEIVGSMTSADPESSFRQIGVIDAQGRVAAFTGALCGGWAGHIVGTGYCVLGNILASKTVVQAMAVAYDTSAEDFPERLLASLEAGQAAGGDRRGKQSAAPLIVREHGGSKGVTDRYVDIRVDESPQPISALRRIFKIYDLILLDRKVRAMRLNSSGRWLRR